MLGIGSGGRDRGRRTPGRQRIVSLQLAVAVALLVGTALAGTALAGNGAAATPPSGRGFSSPGTRAWYDDTPLGPTSGPDQYAQAQVSGLTDAEHTAAFLLRYTNHASQVLVGLSGSQWRIEPSGGSTMTGSFTHPATGVFRVEIAGQTVRLLWNGTLVISRQIPGNHPGRQVVPSIWQSSPIVRLAGLRSSTLTSGPATAAQSWLSGASSDQAASGSFGAWRGSQVQIGGTWNDSFDAQTQQWTVCGGAWSAWTEPLDIAVGAIYSERGESWAAAAAGAYDARWTQALTTLKSCWGDRDPALLKLRFAHEMNLPGSWAVHAGEESDFVRAITRFSTLRYRILPRAEIVFCPNDGTSAALGGLDVRRLWPGRDALGRPVADIYSVDSYNMYPHVTTTADFTKKINAQYPDGAPLGLERHREQAEKFGVPFAVSEWSNDGDPGDGGGGGESAQYVRDFNTWARSHAGDPNHPRPGQLLYEVQFNLWNQFAFYPQSIQPLTAAAYRALPWGR
jgi:hypothetical protein